MLDRDAELNNSVLSSPFAQEHHRRLLGPYIYIEDSMSQYRQYHCGVCQKVGTPYFIARINRESDWICGSELCIQTFILKLV